MEYSKKPTAQTKMEVIRTFVAVAGFLVSLATLVIVVYVNIISK